MAAHLIREGYYPDDANTALRLLPERTQWCIEQTGLDGNAAGRSREAARSATSVLVGDEADEQVAEDDDEMRAAGPGARPFFDRGPGYAVLSGGQAADVDWV